MNYKKKAIHDNYMNETIDLDIKYLYILMGLPASGKTTEALKIFDMFTNEHYTLEDFLEYPNHIYRPRYNAVYIDGDSFDKNNLNNEIISNIFNKRNNILIFDGLFLNTNAILNIFDFLNDVGFEPDELRVIQFKNDVDVCIYNDIIRNRNYKAINTILNAEYERFDEALFQQYLISKSKKINYKVYTKDIEILDRDNYFKMVEIQSYLEDKFETNIIDGDISIYNEELKILQSLGGDYGTWETDKLTEVKPDLVTAKEIYIEFLNSIFKNWFKYRTELFSIVEKKEYNEPDYYGGSIDYIEWKVDIGLLFGIAWALDLCERDLFLTKDYPEWSKKDFLNKLKEYEVYNEFD